MTIIRVIIHADGSSVYLSRAASTSLDREKTFDLEVAEIDNLITQLSSVKVEMAKRKRYAAKELLAQAERLDPTVRASDAMGG